MTEMLKLLDPYFGFAAPVGISLCRQILALSWSMGQDGNDFQKRLMRLYQATSLMRKGFDLDKLEGLRARRATAL